jgi:diguanylate cyclase (GGDEF)-like protein
MSTRSSSSDTVSAAPAPRRRSSAWAVYAVIAAMCIVAAMVGWAAVREVQELSQPRAAQSVWHVYQSHEAVQRVAATAGEVAAGRAMEDRLRVDLELLSTQTTAVREFRMLDLQTPEFARAWLSLEQRTTEGLAAIDREGEIDAADAKRIAEQFSALRDTSRFLLVAAQQELNRNRDAFRSRLIDRFWQAATAMSVLIAGLLFLLRRARIAERRQAALADNLRELNRTLEARVAERTQEIESDRMLRSQILEASPSAIVLLRQRDDQPLFMNAKLRHMLGLDSVPSEALSVQRLFADPAAARHFVDAMAAGQPLRDWETIIAGAPPFPALVSARRVDVRGDSALLIWLHDHSQRKRLELELQRLATTDALTGLANRRAFFDRGQPALEAARRYGHQVSMLMIDVDHFKAVNDRHGHSTGDAMLRLLADRLREVLRQADLIARIGGEEFAALMPETDLDAAMQVAERLREMCDGLAPDASVDTAISVSVGVAQWRAGESLDHLLERSDAALYRAKRAGRNRVETSFGDLP